MDATGWAFAIVFWIACGVGCELIARDRGAAGHGLGWFWAGVILGPIGVAYTIYQTRDARPDGPGAAQQPPDAAARLTPGPARFCPMCGTARTGGLRFCRACGIDLGT